MNPQRYSLLSGTSLQKGLEPGAGVGMEQQLVLLRVPARLHERRRQLLQQLQVPRRLTLRRLLAFQLGC